MPDKQQLHYSAVILPSGMDGRFATGRRIFPDR
jgi:hypothetical protein